MVHRLRSAASRSFSTAIAGDGMSGLPKPRSTTSRPSCRSSRFRSLICAKTYGGSDSTRRNVNRETSSGKVLPGAVECRLHPLSRLRDAISEPEAVGICMRCFGPLEPVYDWDALKGRVDARVDRARPAQHLALRRPAAGGATPRIRSRPASRRWSRRRGWRGELGVGSLLLKLDIGESRRTRSRIGSSRSRPQRPSSSASGRSRARRPATSRARSPRAPPRRA